MTAQQTVFSLSLLCMHDFCSNCLKAEGSGEVPQTSTESLLNPATARIYVEPHSGRGFRHLAPAKERNNEKRPKGLSFPFIFLTKSLCFLCYP